MKHNVANDIDGWVKGILESQRRRAMPVMTYPGLALAGLTVREVTTDGAKQAACIEAVGERYDSVAALTLMDLSVEAEAFGCPVRFSDGDVPTVTAPAVRDLSEVDALAVPTIDAGRMPVYLDAARRVAARFDDRPTLGGMIGPYSLAVRLREMSHVMMEMLIEPEGLHRLLEKCTELLIAYAGAFKAAGAGGVLIAEPAAGLIGAEHCEAFSSAHIRRIVEAVQDARFAVVLHNCGNTAALVGSMAGTGARGLHFGNAVEMPAVLAQAPREVLVFGNIDPARVFRAGTAEEARGATRRLLEATAGWKNFVLSSGCDIPPGTPLENIDAFFEALEGFNGS
jgi:uroporphyrinogen decarboxylase